MIFDLCCFLHRFLYLITHRSSQRYPIRPKWCSSHLWSRQNLVSFWSLFSTKCVWDLDMLKNEWKKISLQKVGRVPRKLTSKAFISGWLFSCRATEDFSFSPRFSNILGELVAWGNPSSKNSSRKSKLRDCLVGCTFDWWAEILEARSCHMVLKV